MSANQRASVFHNPLWVTRDNLNVHAFGHEPEEILAKEVLSRPHRTIITPTVREEELIKTLALAPKETITKELLEKKV